MVASGLNFIWQTTKEWAIIIQENLRTCRFENDPTSEKKTFGVYRRDAIKFSGKTLVRYDLIFVDPFYNHTKLKFLFENLEKVSRTNGNIIFLHSDNLNLVETVSNTHLEVVTTRKFGKSIVDILQHKKEASEFGTKKLPKP